MVVGRLAMLRPEGQFGYLVLIMAVEKSHGYFRKNRYAVEEKCPAPVNLSVLADL